MSIDKSLVLKSQLSRRRNVLSRTERIKQLQDDGRWNDGDSIYSLPKVRTLVTKRKGKKEKEAAPAAEAKTETAVAPKTKTPAGG